MKKFPPPHWGEEYPSPDLTPFGALILAPLVLGIPVPFQLKC